MSEKTSEETISSEEETSEETSEETTSSDEDSEGTEETSSEEETITTEHDVIEIDKDGNKKSYKGNGMIKEVNNDHSEIMGKTEGLYE